MYALQVEGEVCVWCVAGAHGGPASHGTYIVEGECGRLAARMSPVLQDPYIYTLCHVVLQVLT